MNGSSSLCLPVEGGLFNFRVAGIAVVHNKLLMHKTTHDNFWSLPGGRVEFFEHSRQTLLREIIEETGYPVLVNELSWVVESFFEYNQKNYHEIGFYYRMQFIDLPTQEEFILTEGDTEFQFRWFDLEELDQLATYPEVITAELLRTDRGVLHFMLNFKNLHQTK
jgi:8-oxo-dGTP pyrophosphatase MutT (NUDIX family)